MLINEYRESSIDGTNCYIFMSNHEALVVDPGVENQHMRQRILDVLDEYNITSYALFLTHLHTDHADCIRDFIDDDVPFYCSIRTVHEAEEIMSHDFRAHYIERYELEGMPTDRAHRVAYTHIVGYTHLDMARVTPISQGDVISVGALRFKAYETPGHTWGCMALLEENMHFLVSGDFLLGHVTPMVEHPDVTRNPLQVYRNSFLHVASIGVQYVLPAHGNHVLEFNTQMQLDWDDRIQRVKYSLKKIAEAGDEGLSGYQAMSSKARKPLGLHDTMAENYERLNSTATSLAYIDYLVSRGLIERFYHHGIRYYRVTDAGRAALDDLDDRIGF